MTIIRAFALAALLSPVSIIAGVSVASADAPPPIPLSDENVDRCLSNPFSGPCRWSSAQGSLAKALFGAGAGPTVRVVRDAQGRLVRVDRAR